MFRSFDPDELAHGSGSTASVPNGLNQLVSIGGGATAHDGKDNLTNEKPVLQAAGWERVMPPRFGPWLFQNVRRPSAPAPAGPFGCSAAKACLERVERPVLSVSKGHENGRVLRDVRDFKPVLSPSKGRSLACRVAPTR